MTQKLGMMAAAVLFGLASACPVRAGLYRTEERPHQYQLKKSSQAIPNTFFDHLRELMLLGNSEWDPRLKAYAEAKDEEEKQRLAKQLKPEVLPQAKYYLLRKKYLQRKEELERKQRRGRSTPEDRLNLSYYLIRLGQRVEALGILRGLEREADPTLRFMVYANLATVYFLEAGGGRAEEVKHNLGNARSYLREALRQWPSQRPGWTAEQLAWYKEAEQLLLKLIGLRSKEVNRAVPGSAGNPGSSYTNVDDLFGVNFVSENGTYEAGALAAAEKAKLKGNEVPLVQQLLIWLPQDSRLYWLLGELENARGNIKTAPRDIETAAFILDDCYKNRGMSNLSLLKEHRRILNEARAKLPKKDIDLLTSASSAKPPVAETGWMPDVWQLLLVGGAGALVLALLAYFQIKEIRRRRLRDTTGPGA